MKTLIAFVTLCGLLTLLTGCQTYEAGLTLPTSPKAQVYAEPPVPPVPAYGPPGLQRSSAPMPPHLGTAAISSRVSPPSTVCELIQRLKDLEREEKTVRLLLKEKLEEQKQELARQQKDLEAINAAGGTTKANEPVKTSNVDSVEQMLSQLLSRLDQMEKRIQLMEKPTLTDVERKDPGLVPRAPAPGGLPPIGIAPR